jgi:hypothetical protein
MINEKLKKKAIKVKAVDTSRKHRRSKRAILQAKNYTIISEYGNKTPFGMIAKLLTSTVKKLKMKTNVTSRCLILAWPRISSYIPW